MRIVSDRSSCGEDVQILVYVSVWVMILFLMCGSVTSDFLTDIVGVFPSVFVFVSMTSQDSCALLVLTSPSVRVHEPDDLTSPVTSSGYDLERSESDESSSFISKGRTLSRSAARMSGSPSVA